MRARERGARVGGGAQVVHQRLEAASRDEHQRGVEDVLARRAVVDVLRGVRSDGRAERRDERHDRLGMPRGRGAERGNVEVRRVARGRDRLGSLDRDEVAARARARERRLDVEQRLQPGCVARRSSGSAAREDPAEEGRQTAKKTVSSRPWRWMSNR